MTNIDNLTSIDYRDNSIINSLKKLDNLNLSEVMEKEGKKWLLILENKLKKLSKEIALSTEWLDNNERDRLMLKINLLLHKIDLALSKAELKNEIQRMENITSSNIFSSEDERKIVDSIELVINELKNKVWINRIRAAADQIGIIENKEWGFYYRLFNWLRLQEIDTSNGNIIAKFEIKWWKDWYVILDLNREMIYSDKYKKILDISDILKEVNSYLVDNQIEEKFIKDLANTIENFVKQIKESKDDKVDNNKKTIEEDSSKTKNSKNKIVNTENDVKQNDKTKKDAKYNIDNVEEKDNSSEKISEKEKKENLNTIHEYDYEELLNLVWKNWREFLYDLREKMIKEYKENKNNEYSDSYLYNIHLINIVLFENLVRDAISELNVEEKAEYKQNHPNSTILDAIRNETHLRTSYFLINNLQLVIDARWPEKKTWEIIIDFNKGILHLDKYGVNVDIKPLLIEIAHSNKENDKVLLEKIKNLINNLDNLLEKGDKNKIQNLTIEDLIK
jgi:hypothetical protein